MFLTGLADAYFKYDVSKTLAYGFSFDTKTISEMLASAAATAADMIGNIISLF